jgi:ABC-type transporter Mla maintaining outer membrane lipid asymmetry ATPase subunit MlaF
MRRKINQVSSNVEFYDEIFDTGTDSVGIELILKVLRERIDKNDICAYVVSHRKEIKEKIDGEIIMLEKSGKITRRIID